MKNEEKLKALGDFYLDAVKQSLALDRDYTDINKLTTNQIRYHFIRWHLDKQWADYIKALDE